MNMSERDQEGIVHRYRRAKEFVIEMGFAWEIEWQEHLSFEQICERDFLREAGWVVLSCGMREAVIRKRFMAVSAAFRDWESAEEIGRNANQCRERALEIFCHLGKIDAILEIAKRVARSGFVPFKSHIKQDGVGFLQTLPFMGPATSYHLAKNLGLDEVKPDRHLVRISEAAGFDSPRELCEKIAAGVGDRISVVDVVLWRFATLFRDYTKHFVSEAGFRSYG